MEVPAPQAPKRPQELKIHGDIRVDPWFWLRVAEDPATMDYLKAENAYTEAMMKPTEGLQKALYAEMRGRIKEDDSSVPEKEGDYYYYTRFEEGGQYPIHCRKYGTLDAEEEVLLNVNQLAEGKDYLRVGVFKNSPDHQWLAYSLDIDGSEQYRIYVKNLETAELLDETIPNSYYSLEWANDSQTFFYDVLDQYHRPVKVLRHLLGNDPAMDSLVYEETDQRFFVGLRKSASKRFIFVTAEGNNMSEWYFLDADHPDSPLTLVEPRCEDFEYEVVDHDQRFLIRHNGDGARDFKVSQTLIAAPGKENWQDFIPHEPGRPILRLYPFEEHLAISYRTKGLPQIQVRELSEEETHTVGFGEEVYSVRVQRSREWDTPNLRFTYASMTTPPTIYDYNMETRERQFKKQIEVLGGFASENYETRRLWAPARDGAQIPISVLYRKGASFDGSAPLYLYGYGSYGLVMEAEFSSARLSLVDRGFIYAIAHVRGGMEMGWDWYQDGKLLKKMNTFTDFIDCAEYLIKEGYAARGNIVAAGGSAGGMLMGVVVNLRPDLFRAVVAHVPFVDVLNTMLDRTLPLTTMEYNEWGNPEQKEYYEYIKSYSPYDNIKAQAYPHLLITGGISDPRVTYWEPAKWAARLRDTKIDDNLLLLKIHMDSGHGGASGRFQQLEEVALEYAFILKAFGME
jgi:oligopeptidase B